MARAWVEVTRSYEGHPHDFLVAFNTVIGERFGPDAIRGHKPAWFKYRMPLSYYTIKTGCHTEQHAFGGPLEIKGVPGFFVAGDGVLTAVVPNEWRTRADELLLAVHRRLEDHSIYRAKAVTANLEFMDLDGIRFDQLAYSAEVEDDLQANIWNLLEQPEACRKGDIALQRKVLLSGPFGSGKTMALLRTAVKAVANGWTFIHIPPSLSPSNMIAFTLEFARKYQPGVVSIEDFDREQREQNPHAFGNLMNAIDGAFSKTARLIVVMTTNYPDKIGAALQRPGRIDKIIDFGRFSGSDIERVLRLNIPAGMLDAEIDWTRVATACEGYTPAFVREVGTHAKLWSIKANSEHPIVTQSELVTAANGLRHQHKLCSTELGFKTK